MNRQQYGMLVIMLSGIGQIPKVFDGLDDAELENLMWLLRQAAQAAEQEDLRRHGRPHTD